MGGGALLVLLGGRPAVHAGILNAEPLGQAPHDDLFLAAHTNRGTEDRRIPAEPAHPDAVRQQQYRVHTVVLVRRERAAQRWGDAEQRAAAARLRAEVADAGVEVLTDAVVTGRYDGNLVAVLQRSVPSQRETVFTFLGADPYRSSVGNPDDPPQDPDELSAQQAPDYQYRRIGRY